jgi:NAD(P)-dependent dehydrogenase (short-subunit alcohol dehydrogenase family)
VRELRDKVAVITGAASGIGRALAERCADEGMIVVLADIEADALANAEAELGRRGARVLAVATDVSRADDVERLARETWNAFGAAHLVCNNAGVALDGPIWECSLEDWRWVLDVNLWGVIHGVRSFVPRMLAQGSEGHVVNVASVAGLISEPGLGVYKASKHAVVSISETLHHELRERGANVSVSVVCPGFVRTRIADAQRNRPERDAAETARPLREAVRRAFEAGSSPADVAAKTLEAVRADRFYVLTHPEWKEAARRRLEDVLDERNPSRPGA